MSVEDDQVRARQRKSAVVTALFLGGFAVLMFGISIVKLTGAVAP